MSSALISTRVWPTVAAESVRYWLRRHRPLLLLLVAGVAVAVATAVAGEIETADQILLTLLFYVPAIAGLLTMAGIVADERESGIILIWYQKAGSMLRYYIIRYALYQGMLALFVLALAFLVFTMSSTLRLLQEVDVFRLPLLMVPMAAITAAIVFALSAWGARRDSAAALLTIIGSVVIAALLTRSYGPARSIVMAISFPIDALAALGGAEFLRASVAHPVAIVVGQLIGWTALGLLGLRHTQRTLQRVD